MTTTLQEQWFKTAVGRAINPDNAYGLQCVDVADDYANAIFPGVGWAQSIGGVGGAREFTGRNNKYVRWIANVPGNLTNIPVRGDIIIFGGTAINPYGHVAVVLSANAHTATVIQEDGYLQVPAHVATLPYDGPGTGPCTGWMRPLVSEPAKAKNVRTTGPVGSQERSQPSTVATSKRLRVFGPGLDLTMKGYYNGERVGGSNLWYVGISGNYFHSSGFTTVTANGLPNLTPVAPAPKPVVTKPPVLTATQRFAGAAGSIMRKTPELNGALVESFKPGDVLNLKGYVVAKDPYGGKNPNWFVGISGNYVWSGTTTSPAVGALPNLTPKPAVVTPAPAPVTPTPAPVETYTFPKRWTTVTKVVPAALTNFQRGNFPDRPIFAVIHQMDDPDKHPTLAGTAAWFQQERDAPSSAHFGAEGRELWAFVDTVDRAFAAGAVGNNYINIEVPPNPDAQTIETVKAFLREWRAAKGYELQLVRHMDVPGNNTTCGTYIPLEAFSITEAPGADVGGVIDYAEAINLLERILAWLKSKV
jgi:hypothetical protein